MIPLLESGVSVPRDENNRSEAGSVRAVDRAIAILQAFRPDMPSMSVIDIQRRVGLSRPTVYRLLETLASHGFVRVHGTPQRYSLDYAAGQLAQVWLAGLDPARVARPVIERLHTGTRETVSFALLRGQQHVYVIELTSPHALSMSRGLGPKEHLTRGASGKAILAFMARDAADEAIKDAPAGIVREALLLELETIRGQGYAVARSEVIPGVVAVAAPVFNQADEVTGAVVVFGPEVRLPDERVKDVIRMVVDSAREISGALGHAASRGS